MLEVSRVSFLIRVDEYKVKWGRGRGKGANGFCSWSEDNVDLMNETRGGEVLRCYLDTMGVYIESGNRTVVWDSASEPSRRVPASGGQQDD